MRLIFSMVFAPAFRNTGVLKYRLASFEGDLWRMPVLNCRFGFRVLPELVRSWSYGL